MLSVLASAFAAFGTVLVAVFLARGWRAGRQGSWPFRAPFLGGGAPDTQAWSRFHARYYPMTLVFVAFEMEMMFMYP